MESTTIAVDLAKSVFQMAVSHRTGPIDAERRLSRDRFLTYFAQRPRCCWRARATARAESTVGPCPNTCGRSRGDRSRRT